MGRLVVIARTNANPSASTSTSTIGGGRRTVPDGASKRHTECAVGAGARVATVAIVAGAVVAAAAAAVVVVAAAHTEVCDDGLG